MVYMYKNKILKVMEREESLKLGTWDIRIKLVFIRVENHMIIMFVTSSFDAQSVKLLLSAPREKKWSAIYSRDGDCVTEAYVMASLLAITDNLRK